MRRAQLADMVRLSEARREADLAAFGRALRRRDRQQERVSNLSDARAATHRAQAAAQSTGEAIGAIRHAGWLSQTIAGEIAELAIQARACDRARDIAVRSVGEHSVLCALAAAQVNARHRERAKRQRHEAAGAA